MPDLKPNVELDDDAYNEYADAVKTPIRLVPSQLRSLVSRIENLEEEKATIADQIKEVYEEAKGAGFNTKALKAVITKRRQNPNEAAEQEALIDLYMSTLESSNENQA